MGLEVLSRELTPTAEPERWISQISQGDTFPMGRCQQRSEFNPALLPVTTLGDPLKMAISTNRRCACPGPGNPPGHQPARKISLAVLSRTCPDEAIISLFSVMNCSITPDSACITAQTLVGSFLLTPR